MFCAISAIAYPESVSVAGSVERTDLGEQVEERVLVSEQLGVVRGEPVGQRLLGAGEAPALGRVEVEAERWWLSRR